MTTPNPAPPAPGSVDWRNYYEWEAAHKRFLPGEEPSEHLRVDFVHRLLEGVSFQNPLDAGCGNGYLASRLAERVGGHSTGTDLSLARLKEARVLFPAVRFTRASLFDQPFPDRSFDLVTAVEVVEHLESPPDALKELKRLSSRYVLVTVPYRGRLEILHCPHCNQSYYHDGHIQSFDEDRMKSLVQAAGLKLLKLEVYVPYYPPTRFPATLLPAPLHKAARGVLESLKLARKTPGKYLGALAERVD